jgi:hypothetical protein
MTGPKHLWSGDWESESARTADDLASYPAPVFDQQPETEPEPQAAKRRWTRRQFAIALATGVAAAAITVGLVSTLGGSNHKPRSHKQAATQQPAKPQSSGGGGLTTPAQPCQQTVAGCSQTTAAAPTITGPYAEWMGMQIVTSPSGVVVETVKLGSPADLAGFEPGDQIMALDTHVVGTVSQLRTDTDGLKVGDKVTFAVLRQSVQLSIASMPMTDRPTIHP